MAQEDSRRLLKAEVWVRFEDIPTRICGGQYVVL